jgi:hypothetical protein
MRRFVLWTFMFGAACAGSPALDNGGAPPDPPAARISLTIAGTGAVLVPALHSSCHGSCSFPATPGAYVHLEVAEHLQASFAGWSGACVGNGACDVVVGDDVAIGATFYP